MANTIRNREEIEEKYKWDLSSLFKSDEEFEKAMESIDEDIRCLSSYQGKLNNAKNIRDFYDVQTNIYRKWDNIGNYASLRNAENTSDEKAQAMIGKAMSRIVMLETAMAFATKVYEEAAKKAQAENNTEENKDDKKDDVIDAEIEEK